LYFYPSANDDISPNALQHAPKLEIPPPAENPVARNGQEWSGNELESKHVPYLTLKNYFVELFFPHFNTENKCYI